MSTPATITFTNMDELERHFDQMPDKVNTLAKKAARAGGRKAAAHIRKGVPSRYKKLCRFKLYRNDRGLLSVRMGLFNNGAVSGHQNKGYDSKNGVEDWFKAYWQNYGTLGGRDPNHQFDRAVKAGRRGSKGGIRATNFVEAAAERWDEVFAGEYEKVFNEGLDKI